MHWWKILPNQIRLSKFSVSAPKIFFNFFSGNEKSMVLPTEDSHQRRRFCYLFFVSPTPSDRPSSFDWWTSGSENSSSISHCCQSKYISSAGKRTKENTTLHSFFHFLSVTVILCHALLLVTVSLISSLHDCATSACVLKLIAAFLSFAGHFRSDDQRIVNFRNTVSIFWDV